MKAGDKIKVHLYFDNKEIKTRAYNNVFEVYENGGRLGIYWTEDFTPFENFAQTVIFENVETGERCFYSNIAESLVLLEA